MVDWVISGVLSLKFGLCSPSSADSAPQFIYLYPDQYYEVEAAAVSSRHRLDDAFKAPNVVYFDKLEADSSGFICHTARCGVHVQSINNPNQGAGIHGQVVCIALDFNRPP